MGLAALLLAAPSRPQAPAPEPAPAPEVFKPVNGEATRMVVASWYGESHRGRLTANGERFNPDDLTAASWDYPFGTRLLVAVCGRSVVVRVNDRGPAKRLHRELDLSHAAAAALGMERVGLAIVTVKPL